MLIQPKRVLVNYYPYFRPAQEGAGRFFNPKGCWLTKCFKSNQEGYADLITSVKVGVGQFLNLSGQPKGVLVNC